MYEAVEVVNKGKKRKRISSSNLEEIPKSKKISTTKCRGVFGAEKRDLWCKNCKNKKKCTKFPDQ